MEAKLAKLQVATDQAEADMKQKALAVEDSQQRMDAAKALLRQLDAEEQGKIMVADTKLPELLALHHRARDDYETSVQRYETNRRYLQMLQEKLAGQQSSEAAK